MRACSVLLLSLPVFALTGCQPSTVDTLKKMPMPKTGNQMTVEATFSNHVNCGNVTWKSFEERTISKVRVTCEVKDLDNLRHHLKDLEQTVNEQALERFKMRQKSTIANLQQSIKELTQQIEINQKKSNDFKPITSVPKNDHFRVNCDDYAQIAKSSQERIDKNEYYVEKFCTEGSKTYHKAFCEQARFRYNDEVPRLKKKVAEFLNEQKACKQQQADDRKRLIAINEKRAEEAQAAQDRRIQMIESYKADIARKEMELIDVQNSSTDSQYEKDRAENAKLAGIHQLKSLSLQFVFQMTVDQKAVVIDSVNSKIVWDSYDAPLYQHLLVHPFSYDAKEVLTSMINNSKVWSYDQGTFLSKQMDNTLISIYQNK